RWPRPLGFEPTSALHPPRDFDRLPWLSHPLTAGQVELKAAALAAHRTQIVKDRMYLNSFVKSNELFDPWQPIRISRNQKIPHPLFSQGLPAPAEESANLEAVERRHIEQVLTGCNGVIEGPKGAAAALGLHPSTLRSRMQKLGMRGRRE
ncbi:MAG TPA: helix-turn-helix domain-containing protein, partial [Plasticicumulans sp.]|nr:helix-turn-helix domain-containing protein [Plasticicumulans sp.]